MKIRIIYPTGRKEVIDVQSGEQGFINIMQDQGDDNFHEQTSICILKGELVGYKFMRVDQGRDYAEWGNF